MRNFQKIFFENPLQRHFCYGFVAFCKAQTKRECDALTEAAEHKRAQTEADCAALRAKTEQEIAARRAAFEQSTRELLRSRCDTDILPEEGKVK